MVLRVEREGGVAVVTLDRPEARNALSGELIRALRTTFAQLDGDDGVGAVVLTGADPAFCAGLDLHELAGSGANLGMVDAAGPLGALRTPVVGAINGAAYTGGLEVALCCDIRIASERAVFADTHGRVGVMPGWGLTVRLPAAVGQARALEMSLAGTKVGAALALSWGLVNHVVPHEDLLPTARDIAGRIAALRPDATAKLLEMYRSAVGRPQSDALAQESLESRQWIASLDRSSVPTPDQLK